MKPIKRTKLYEEVVDQIVEMIRKNDMKAGDRLASEKELASIFDVSRTVIREALTVMHTMGIIEVKHGSGIYVKDVIKDSLADPIMLQLVNERDNLINIMELRKGLEAEAAFLAASRASSEDILKLDKIVESMIENQKQLDTTGLMSMKDFDFHMTLVQSAHNPVFSKIYATIVDVYYEGLSLIFSGSVRPREEVLQEHKVVVDAIKNRDDVRARDSIRQHLTNAENRLRKLLK